MTDVQINEQNFTVDVNEIQSVTVSGISANSPVTTVVDEDKVEVTASNLSNSYNLTIQGATSVNPQIIEQGSEVNVSETTQQIQVSPVGSDNNVNVTEQTTTVTTVTGFNQSVDVIFGSDIELTGDVVGGGGQNKIQTNLTSLSPDPSGTYSLADVTVDSKGRVTSASSNTVQSISVNKDNFTVQNNGETQWSINTIARELIAVFINQLDYSYFCTLNTSTGTVTYDDTAGGYFTEVNDLVAILWKT